MTILLLKIDDGSLCSALKTYQLPKNDLLLLCDTTSLAGTSNLKVSKSRTSSVPFGTLTCVCSYWT